MLDENEGNPSFEIAENFNFGLPPSKRKPSSVKWLIIDYWLSGE
jgi:hypothetical protein